QSQPAQTASQPATPGQPAQLQTAAGSVQAPAATPTVAAALETETTVENEQYKIVFTNRGAQVKHWILKKYSDTAGKPLDMVQPQASEKFGFPLSLFTYEPALNEELNKKALYQVTASGAQPSVTGHAEVPATNALTFHYAANGLDVVKTFRFDTSYVLIVEAEVKRNGAPVRALVQWPAGLGDMEEFVPSSQPRSQVPISASSLFAWSLDGKQNSIAAKKVSGNATLDQPYEYAAITDLYFAAAFLPGAPERATLVTLHNSIDIDMPGSMTNSTAQKRPADVIGLAVGDASGSTRLRLYAGPKQLDLLKTIHATGADGKPTGQSLEPLIQFGWMTIIAKPLYLALRFLRGLLGPGIYNWGWAIIIVTSLFTLLMLPTRFMMLKSSLKMMRIQPKVDAIKQRYANLKATDPKRANMNAEMMELYKVEGVNMYGSCLPMLVQMPLFIAYYQVLRNAVELRQAHWFWLTDLSVADPSHVLPILIILTMFFTQYITPSPGMDAAQRRMMAFMMPVVMGFVLWSLPSGLALYWGTSNIINLALQIGINQSHIGKEMNAIAAKRAVKKAGVNPKTIQGRR
ncbi:MAG TPA: membrane protein insertase YidC, partial [Terracidiphilus sp.]|nr:membrane protein insertase YidC [Terracidiphilus sp.]